MSEQTTTPAADPAARLQAAAAHLRTLLANPQLTAGPWLSMDDGDRLLRNQPGDEDAAPIYVVNEPMSNGANAAWIAAMHPGTGAALAFVLDIAESYLVGAAGNVHLAHVKAALELADAILAGGGQ